MMKYFSPTQDLQIRELMRQCGQQAEKMAAGRFQVFQKGPNDYVTNIDRALDQQLTAGFSTLFPEDGVITEENPRSRQAFNTTYSRLWLIDPLDGTEDFIQGKSEYAVMVGLLQSAQPVAGWVYAPAQDRMYYGGPDWGLFHTVGDDLSEPLPVAEPDPPSADFCPVIIGSKDQVNFGAAIAQLIPEVQFYSLGSFGLKVLEVVQGHAGLYLYLNGRVKLWDTTGPLALAQAAGLVCCDLSGQPISFLPDQINADTLAHEQPVLVGWPQYMELLRPKIQQAVALVEASAPAFQPEIET